MSILTLGFGYFCVLLHVTEFIFPQNHILPQIGTYEIR